MAVTYIAARPINLAGTAYAAGATVNTTGWNPNVLSTMIRLGWIEVQSASAAQFHTAGLLANMPANGAQPDGSTYLATDQNGGTPYLMVAGVWVQESVGVASTGGKELARATYATASQAITAEADLTGMTITFTVTTRPVDVIGFAPVVTQSAAGGAMVFKITDGSNAEKARTIRAVTSQIIANASLHCEERITTPGTYTRKLRASNNGTTGNVTVFGTATLASIAPYISAVER